MKKLFFLFFFTSLALQIFSQSILDLFLLIPDTAILGLPTDVREKIVACSKDNKSISDAYEDLEKCNINYAFNVVDLKNGFINLIGYMEGHAQMCYWNLTNGNKLVAVYVELCGPDCYVDQFNFYEYNGKEFFPRDLYTILPVGFDDFLLDKEKSKREMEKHQISASLLFELPREGVNVVAKWGNHHDKETYSRYARGNRMILIWDNGEFKRGDIFWK